MPGRRSTTRALAAGAAVLALTLAGCGGDDEPEPASASASTDATQDATEGATEATAPAETTGSGDTRVGNVLADALEKGRTAHVTMTMGEQMRAEGDMDLSSDSPAMDITMTMSGQEARMIMVDDVLYVQMRTHGDKFIRLDAAQAGQMTGFDPSRMVDQLRALEGGEDLGDGHYRYRQQEATVDVFVGDDGLIERMLLDSGGAEVEMTCTDWGKDVDIETPASKDTIEMPNGQPLR